MQMVTIRADTVRPGMQIVARDGYLSDVIDVEAVSANKVRVEVRTMMDQFAFEVPRKTLFRILGA